MPEPCRSCERRELDWGGCRCQAYLLAGDAGLTDPACSLSPAHDAVVALREGARKRSRSSRVGVIVRVFGSAAGGGVPQWNCACFNCSEARAGRAPRRTQSGVAVSADGERWLLLNCSPDIAEQIEAFVPLHPRPPRDTPIGGMLFTDANVDHIGGLAMLRQRGQHSFRPALECAGARHCESAAGLRAFCALAA